MLYYKFHIGDYKAHTSHLDPLEDIAYRRMIDWQYLHEKELPLDVEVIAKAIGMRTHNESITYVLQEFYEETAKGYINKRVSHEIAVFRAKSEKARNSAMARWASDDDANALPTQSDCNANQITNKPINQVAKKRIAAFTPPTLDDCKQYSADKCPNVDPVFFFNYFTDADWIDSNGKAVKNWKQKMLTWEKSETQKQPKSSDYMAGGI